MKTETCINQYLDEALKVFMPKEKSIERKLLVENEKTFTDARIGDVGLHEPCNDENNKNKN